MKETNFINETNHEILKYVGGKVSLEMQCPKLLWLKTNLNLNCWAKAGRFFDLPDFLTWKCTGVDSRLFSQSFYFQNCNDLYLKITVLRRLQVELRCTKQMLV